jgi:hypothetical protein
MKKETVAMGINDSRETRDAQLKTANDVVREDILPSVAKGYDEAGPAVVMTLAVILADIWLASGFTSNDWREIIAIFDSPPQKV